MSITLDLGPDLEERLSERAAAQGMSLEEFLLTMIEATTPIPAPAEDATLEEFEAAMDAFSEGSEAYPVLPPEALTREAIYEGR